MLCIFHTAALQIPLASCKSASDPMKLKPELVRHAAVSEGLLAELTPWGNGGLLNSMCNLLTLGSTGKGQEKGGDTEVGGLTLRF